MKYFVYLFFILSLSYSCFKPPSPPLQLLCPPEKGYLKRIGISGTYTFTKGAESFQFNTWYSYGTESYTNFSADLIFLRFRLYNKENKLLRERLPFISEEKASFIRHMEEFSLEKIVRIRAYIPYHKDGVKIKVILVDDEGKDRRVLAEKSIISPEEVEVRKRFYEACL